MIIGCLGKGGSGKSSVATALIHTAERLGYSTLAIDADHNMDLLFNLMGEVSDMPYLGSRRAEIVRLLGVEPGERLFARVLREPRHSISLANNDPLLALAARERSSGHWLMAAGPHTEEVQRGSACSHVLANVLKAILPLLALKEREVAVVDSTAGMDMVGSGISVGMDLCYVVCEPTIHSTKTAKQIAEGLGWFGVPYRFILNKVQHEDQKKQAEEWLGAPPLYTLAFAADEAVNASVFEEMLVYAQTFAKAESGQAVRLARVEKALHRAVEK